MGECIVVDVVDRPAGGSTAALRRLRALARAPEVRAVVGMRTIRFTDRLVPRFTPRRLAVLSSYADRAAAERLWPELMGELAAGGEEHWHVRGDAVRAHYTEPREGWVPEVVGGDLADDEPALIVISGELHPRYVRRFTHDQRAVVRHAEAAEGYLGGVGAQSTVWDTTSISAWRTYADTKRYAYSSGAHREAMTRDLAEERHRTSWFLRVRPFAETGTLDGSSRLAGVLAPPRVPRQASRRRAREQA